jgi:hypothetical protein
MGKKGAIINFEEGVFGNAGTPLTKDNIIVFADDESQGAPVSHTHEIADVNGLQDELDGKVDDSQVLTDVPAGAVFTDTTYNNLNQLGTRNYSDLQNIPTTFTPSSHTHAGEDITTGTIARARVGVKPIKTILTEDLTAGKYIAIEEDKNYWLHFNTGADATIQIDDSFGPDFELEGNAAINNTLTVEGIGGCNVYYPDGFTSVIEKKGVFGWKQNGGNYGYLFGALIPA